MIVEFLLLVVLAYGIYIIYDRRKTFAIRDRLGVPGPTPSILKMGNNYDIDEGKKRHNGHIFGLLDEYRNTYGETFGWYIGKNLTICSFDPEMIRSVLITDFSKFTDRLRPILAGGHIMAKGLVQVGGQRWKVTRSFLSPIFSTGKLKQMSGSISENTDIMLKQFGDHAKIGDVVNVYDSFQALTLDVIGKLAFALPTNCQENRKDPFFVNCQTFFNSINPNSFKLLKVAIHFPELGALLSRFRSFTKMGAAEANILDGLQQVLEARKKCYKTFEGVDILQLLLKQQEDIEGQRASKEKSEFGLDDEMILANSLTFLLAGYETTSTALTYTAWCLARNPEVQEKLQQEIDRKLAADPSINYTSVRDMPYLDAVFKESLRLYPPVPMFVFRMCTEDCVVRGQRFEKGVRFIAPVYNLQHDPEVFENPEEFIPERFLEGQEYPEMSWLPFGTGPRNCLGLRFADMEFKIALVKTLSRFSFILPHDAPAELDIDSSGALYRPYKGVHLKVKSRG